MLLRSFFSSILTLFEGVSVWNHPVLSNLCRSFFDRRPPSRRLFPSWNVASVFAVFDGWLRPLDFSALQRRCAFFFAIASSRRPSEWASLRCDPAFMIISPDSVRFLPSQLCKTDRQTHMGPPILIRRLPPSSPHCPVAALEDLLHSRTFLGIRHNYVFSSRSSHHHPISVCLSQTSFDGRFVRRGLTPRLPPLVTSPFLRQWLVDSLSTMRFARAIGRVPAPSSGTIFVRPELRVRSEILPGAGLGEITRTRVSSRLVASLSSSSRIGRTWQYLRQFDRPGESPHTPYR